jgi:hypothetical protein
VPALLHLLGCGACREKADSVLCEVLLEVAAGRPEASEELDLSEGAIAAMAEKATAALRLAEGLAALPAAEVRAAAAADPRIADPLVGRALVLIAEEALDDPARAERAGEAAAALVSSLAAEPSGENLDLLLRGLWTALRSHRQLSRVPARRGRLPAGAAVPGPGRTGPRGSGDAAGRRRAAALVRAAARRGGGAVRPGGAVVRRGARAAGTGLALSWCEPTVGRADRAREALAVALCVEAPAPRDGEEVARDWWEARIAAVMGADPEGADLRLDAVRRRLLAGGSLAEAARCTLDLVAQRVAAGRLDALGGLGHDLLAAFAHRGAALRSAAMTPSSLISGRRDDPPFRIVSRAGLTPTARRCASPRWCRRPSADRTFRGSRTAAGARARRM